MQATAFEQNWQPFIPEPTGEKGNSAGAASSAASIVFFACDRLRSGLDRWPGGEDPRTCRSASSVRWWLHGHILVSIVLTMIVPYTELVCPIRCGCGRAFGPQWGGSQDHQGRCDHRLTRSSWC
jgi:hypothetical protein